MRKGFNFTKCLISFYLSKWMGKPIVMHQPFMLSFEPTTSCNLGCPECPSGLKSFTRPIGQATLDLYLKLLDEQKEDLIYLYLYFQGEPLMNKDLPAMISEAHKRNIYTVTSTNGHFLTERVAEQIVASGLDRLLISIDGTTQEVYESYRKQGSLEKVLQGTQNIVEAKKKLGVSHPEVIFQMLVVQPNEHQIDEVQAIADKLGVNQVVYKTAQVYDFENGSEWIPTIDKFSRYKQKTDGTWAIKNKLDNQCWKLWHSAVSTWDGKILPCCFDKDAQYEMGNIQEKSFKEIWQSQPYTQFRQSLLHSRKDIDICKNCSEGTVVWESI